MQGMDPVSFFQHVVKALQTCPTFSKFDQDSISRTAVIIDNNNVDSLV